MQIVLTNGKTSPPVEDLIRERLENGNGNTLLFIVPNEQARLKRQRECLGHVPRRAVAGLNIYTFESLVKRLSTHASVEPPVSRGLQMLWLRDIVDSGHYPSLKSSPTIPLPQRIVTELLNAIIQLKTSGVDASQMRTASSDSAFRSLTTDTATLADFITVYEDYNKLVGDRWTDCESVHGGIANRLATEEDRGNQLIRSAFPNVNLVVVEFIDGISGANLSILEGIVRLPGLAMYIKFDWNAENDTLFGHLKQNYTRFLELGFHQVSELENRSSRNSTVVRHFSRNLFRKIKGVQPSVEKLDLTNRITLLKTHDRVKEVEAVAELIKERTQNGFPSAPHSVCLTYFNLERYVPLIREVFPIYGITYALHEATPLSTSPFATALFSLLDTIEENVNSPSEDRLQNPYFIIENLTPFIASCGFNADMSPGDFRQSITCLMQTSTAKQQILNHDCNVLRDVQPSIIEQEIGAFRNAESLISELVEFLSSRYGAKQSHPLRSYIDWLRFMASQTTYHLQSQTDSSVSVLSLAQTRGLDFDIVILGGLIDGEFPATFRPDAFVPPNLRHEASDLLREQRFLFYQALNLFREHLYLVVPECADGVDLIQSPFIDELVRIADITVEQAKSDVLFSPEQFLKHYGKSVWAQLEEVGCSSSPVPPQFSNLTSAARRVLPVVKNSVRVEESRGITHHLSQYAGQLSPQQLSVSSLKKLNKFQNRIYPVRELESYGQCPFQFFSEYVLLRLKHEHDEEENEDGLTSLGKGRRLHEILVKFYTMRRGKPAIAQCTDIEFEAALKELTQIAKDTLSVYSPRNLFWEVEMEAIIGGKGKRGILPRFLDQERERKLLVDPCYFEVGFGRGDSSIQGDSTLSSKEPVKVGKVNLTGKIDRVEIGNGIFTIGDYTTGANIPKIRAIREGRSLQLSIYLAVVEQLLGKLAFQDFKAVGGIYYILRENGKAELGIGDREYNGIAFKAHSSNHQLLPRNSKSKHRQAADFEYEEESMQSVIDRTVLYVSEYVSSISNGKFPLTPHDPQDVCRHCEFKRICRIGAISEDDVDR